MAGLFARALRKTQEKTGKPIHVLVIQHRQNDAVYDAYRRLFINKLNKHSVAWLAEPFSLAARTYAKLAAYRMYLSHFRSQRSFPA